MFYDHKRDIIVESIREEGISSGVEGAILYAVNALYDIANELHELNKYTSPQGAKLTTDGFEIIYGKEERRIEK